MHHVDVNILKKHYVLLTPLEYKLQLSIMQPLVLNLVVEISLEVKFNDHA